MPVTFDLPSDIEHALRDAIENFDSVAKEAALIELYRQRKLSHYQLSQALGISRFEADAVMKAHDVPYHITIDDVRRESESIAFRTGS